MKFNLKEQETIIEHYGIDNQLSIHMEECAELLQAISKTKRDWNKNGIDIDNFNYTHLIEEISDVIVCIDQLKWIFNISDKAIEYNANRKIERQIRRIEDEKSR